MLCGHYLDLLLVKHAQPLQIDNISQTLSEGQTVRPDLLVESVVSHQMDVGYSVCRGHRNIFASQLEFNHLSQKGTSQICLDALVGNITVRQRCRIFNCAYY